MQIYRGQQTTIMLTSGPRYTPGVEKTPPEDGDFVTIPAGNTILLDVDTPVLKVLLIAGMLFHLLLDGGVSNKIIIIMKKKKIMLVWHISHSERSLQF